MDFFNYQLPAERIAQRPVYPYDQAKLLIVDREFDQMRVDSFSNIANYLRANDLLIFNNTAVRPSRLFGKLSTGGHLELLLVRSSKESTWWCLARPLKKLLQGKILYFEEGLEGIVLEQNTQQVLIEFNLTDDRIKEIALMPIPPYIRRGHGDKQDLIDYQTSFAEIEGSIAAPTASLHFTPELLTKLKAKEISLEYLTLHVGTASFLPLQFNDQDSITPPGSEDFWVNEDLIKKILQTKANRGRVIAVGTTAVRALESSNLTINNYHGSTELFIQPGYKFKVIDAMVTNFHQPSTTHLMLVQAFLGYNLINESYKFALENEFRFLSYGDGMLCL